MLKIAQVFAIIKEKRHRKKRDKDNKIRKEVFNNPNLSLFSCNCVGCCMLNDVGARFNSPFVNLYLEAKDFLKYLERPEYYNSQAIHFIESENFPVGFLGDVKIYFVHYKSEEDAQQAWERRVKRINYDNLFVIFSDREGCTYTDLKRFDNLPFANKIVFVHKNYPEIKSGIYIKGFEDEECVGNLINWEPGVLGKRYYDNFDFVSWFNGETDLKKVN